MALPRQEFYSLDELSARWTAQQYQIGQWAGTGLLDLVTSIGPVEAGGEELAGIVSVCAADLQQMFRRDGSGPASMRLHRLRRIGEQVWRKVNADQDGVLVSRVDLVVSAKEVARFETNHKIFGTPHSGKGPEPRYDWDEFWRQVALRVFEKGVPGTLTEFTNEFSDWFAGHNPGGQRPSDSVIRKRLSPLWNQIRFETEG